MYTELNEIIEQPTSMNNKVILYTELTTTKVDEYIDKLVANTAFGRPGDIYASYGNDFVYLLIHLIDAYNYSIEQVNAGETYGEDEVYSDFGLEAIRNYFQVTHSFDIVPLYGIFGLIDNDCSPDDLFGTETDYVNLDCLILNY